jgi:hypothetical protein
MLISFLLGRRISFTTPAPERARLGTELQQLYAVGKFAEILARVEAACPKTKQEISSPIRSGRTWCTTY